MKKKWICFGFIFFLVGCHLVPNQTIPTSSLTVQPTRENVLVTQIVSVTESTVVVPSTVPTLTKTATILPSVTPTVFLFKIQANSPVYIQNFGHSEQACAWIGVAGQAFDKTDHPLTNLVVAIKGIFNGKKIDMVALTGYPPSTIYGPGGYEITLSQTPLDSDQLLTIQLFDIKGNTLSDAIKFNTYKDCAKNLIIINFQEIK